MSAPQPSPVPRTPFGMLQIRVAEAHWRWKVWKQIYMIGPGGPAEASERMAMLDSAAPDFFRMLREILLQDVALRLCKLVDAGEGGPSKNRRRNLSLASAFDDAQPRLDSDTAGKVAAMLVNFKAASEPLVKWRHWVFAHDDYEVATGAHTPPRLSDTHINEAMKAAAEIMRLLDPQGADCEFAYDQLIALGDGDSLLYHLRCAVKYREERLAQLKRPLG